MDWKQRGYDLLAEYNACCRARPYHNAIDVEIVKDACSVFASQLNTQLNWGTEQDIEHACLLLEPRLKKFKEKVVMDILSNGTV
jgi:hypothetical protein